MSFENAKLTLKTCYLDTAYKTNKNTSFTWTNINLRTLLGYEMYEKYDTFKLMLSQISSAGTIEEYGATNDENSKMVNILISGLPFVNGTYDTYTHTIMNTCHLTIFNFPQVSLYADPLIQPYLKENSVCFNKNQETVDLKIEYLLSYDDSIPNSAHDYPEMVFTFSIVGVKLSNYEDTNYKPLFK